MTLSLPAICYIIEHPAQFYILAMTLTINALSTEVFNLWLDDFSVAPNNYTNGWLGNGSPIYQENGNNDTQQWFHGEYENEPYVLYRDFQCTYPHSTIQIRYKFGYCGLDSDDIFRVLLNSNITNEYGTQNLPGAGVGCAGGTRYQNIEHYHFNIFQPFQLKFEFITDESNDRMLVGNISIKCISQSNFTSEPSIIPTIQPTMHPTRSPTDIPSINPTSEPTMEPTLDPITKPTVDPTTNPTTEPTTQPITIRHSEQIMISIQLETELVVTEKANITESIIEIIKIQLTLSLNINATHFLTVDIISIDNIDGSYSIILEIKIDSEDKIVLDSDVISKSIIAELKPAIEQEYEGQVIIKSVIIETESDDNPIQPINDVIYWMIITCAGCAGCASFCGLMLIFNRLWMNRTNNKPSTTNTPLPDDKDDAFKYNVIISSANLISAALINDYLLIHHFQGSFIEIVYVTFTILVICYFFNIVYFIYLVLRSNMILDYNWCSLQSMLLITSGDAYTILRSYNSNVSHFTHYLNLIQV